MEAALGLTRFEAGLPPCPTPTSVPADLLACASAAALPRTPWQETALISGGSAVGSMLGRPRRSSAGLQHLPVCPGRIVVQFIKVTGLGGRELCTCQDRNPGKPPVCSYCRLWPQGRRGGGGAARENRENREWQSASQRRGLPRAPFQPFPCRQLSVQLIATQARLHEQQLRGPCPLLVACEAQLQTGHRQGHGGAVESPVVD